LVDHQPDLPLPGAAGTLNKKQKCFNCDVDVIHRYDSESPAAYAAHDSACDVTDEWLTADSLNAHYITVSCVISSRVIGCSVYSPV